MCRHTRFTIPRYERVVMVKLVCLRVKAFRNIPLQTVKLILQFALKA